LLLGYRIFVWLQSRFKAKKPSPLSRPTI